MLILSSAAEAYLPDPPSTPDDSKRGSSINAWPGPLNMHPDVADGSSGFSVVTGTANGPNGQLPSLAIASKFIVFDANQTPIPAAVFNRFLAYVVYQINNTWTNGRMVNNSWTWADNATPPFGNPHMSKQYAVTCNVTAESTTSNTGILEDGEVFVAVKNGTLRSFVPEPGRVAVLYLSPTLTTQLNSSVPISTIAVDDTYGHEFGHVLGLLDRYAFIAYARKDASNDPPEVIREFGHAVGLYVHEEASDPEYAHNYAWMFNLMGAAQPTFPVRVANGRTAKNERFKNIYPTGPPRRTFITKRQLDWVATKKREIIPGNAAVYTKIISKNLYQKATAGSTPTVRLKAQAQLIFKGTFVGLTFAGTNAYNPVTQVVKPVTGVAHDDTYDASRNMNLSGTHTGTWVCEGAGNASVYDDKMMFRRRRINTPKDLLPKPESAFQLPPVWTSSATWSPFFVPGALFLGDLKGVAAPEATPITTGSAHLCPVQLRVILDLEHVDRGVVIRRYIGNLIQDHLKEIVTGNGSEWTLTFAWGLQSRTVELDRLAHIRRTDGVFTATYPSPNGPIRGDILAAPTDLPSRTNGDQLGLYIPYRDFSDDDVDPEMRLSGDGTKFKVVLTSPPVPADVPFSTSHPRTVKHIADTPRLREPTQPPLPPENEIEYGILYATSSGAALLRAIWNANGSSLVNRDKNLRGSNWYSRYIMRYLANGYTNRKYLVALSTNAELSKQDLSQSTPVTVVDPHHYRVDDCFRWESITYAASAVPFLKITRQG